MLLENKSWQTQDYFNEYLSLKEDIVRLSIGMDNDALKEKVDRMKYIIEQLKLKGIRVEELLFLAMNVYVKY